METLDFILLALATFYLSVVLADDLIAGPRGILTWFRRKLGLEYDEYGHPDAPPGSLADLISCVYCNALWIGLFLTIIYALLELTVLPARWLFAPLAAGGLAVLIQELKD